MLVCGLEKVSGLLVRVVVVCNQEVPLSPRERALVPFRDGLWSHVPSLFPMSQHFPEKFSETISAAAGSLPKWAFPAVRLGRVG